MAVSGCTIETCRDRSGLNAQMKQNRAVILQDLWFSSVDVTGNWGGGGQNTSSMRFVVVVQGNRYRCTYYCFMGEKSGGIPVFPGDSVLVFCPPGPLCSAVSPGQAVEAGR